MAAGRLDAGDPCGESQGCGSLGERIHMRGDNTPWPSRGHFSHTQSYALIWRGDIPAHESERAMRGVWESSA